MSKRHSVSWHGTGATRRGKKLADGTRKGWRGSTRRSRLAAACCRIRGHTLDAIRIGERKTTYACKRCRRWVTVEEER